MNETSWRHGPDVSAGWYEGSVCATVESALAALPLPGGWTWRVSLRPRRRTLGIEIAEDGGVLFCVPADASPHSVADAVRSRLPKLAMEVSRRQRQAPQPVKLLVTGTAVNYLSRRYRLRITDGSADASARLRHGWLEVPGGDGREAARQRIAAWYTARGTRWLTARLPPLADRMAVPVPVVAARELHHRWGACHPVRGLSVHWAVMQLPPELIDYVLAHELAHLKTPGHGAVFQRELRNALPDADELAQRFRAEESRMWRGTLS